MPAGRPTDYEERYCEMVIAHMKQGLSFESFAGTIGVHKDTLFEWCKVHPEFSDSKKMGLELCRAYFERIGNAAMLGQPIKDEKTGKTIDFKNFNTTIWVFSMKNRFGWRDRTTVEHEGNPEKPIEIRGRTDEEILNRVTELAAKLKSIESK